MATTPLHPKHEETAKSVFAETVIHITTHGKMPLGAAIGSSEFAEEYVCGKVDNWTKEVEKLAIIATSQTQAAHTAFVHGTKTR